MSTRSTQSSLTVLTSVTSPIALLKIPTTAETWMQAPRTPTVVVTNPLTTAFVTAGTHRPSSEPVFQSYLGFFQSTPTPFVVQTQTLDTHVVPTTVSGPTPSFTFVMRVPTSSKQTGPSRLASTSTDRHSSAFVSISGKDSQYTSESTLFPPLSPCISQKNFQSNRVIIYKPSQIFFADLLPRRARDLRFFISDNFLQRFLV